MTHVLSLTAAGHDARGYALALNNHRDYCSAHGYAHLQDEAGHLPTRALRDLHTLHAAARALRTVAPDELLMVLTSETVIYKRHALDSLMHGRDALMTFRRPRAGDTEPQPQLNWIVLRNTTDVRKRLQATMFDVHKKILHDPVRSHEVMYGRLGALPYYAQIDGHHLNINWKTDLDSWFNADVFLLNALPGFVLGIDKLEFEAGLDDRRLDWVVLGEADKASRGEPHMQSMPTGEAEAPYETMNADSRVAIVTLRTPEIGSYARIGEENVRSYCSRHRLAMHAYRRIPEWADPSVNGTWHKPDLLLRHFDAHEWVLWVDADVLITDPSLDIRRLLEGREVLLAKDLGGYEFNAGVMGFRTTAAMRASLEHVRRRIAEVPDKSGVYSSGSDQEQFIIGFYESGLLAQHEVLDCLSLNTPPALRGPATFMTHYMGLREPYRSIYMAHDAAEARA
jgi:hypothetical protein